MQLLMRYRDLVLPLGIIGCLVVILVPLPPMLMDMLLAANITVGVIVLLTTVYVSTPLEFSSNNIGSSGVECSHNAIDFDGC